MIELRSGRSDDLPAVAAIYSAGIAEHIATFETSPRTADGIAARATDGQPC